VTSDNPYASDSFTIFTSGTAKSSTRVKRASATNERSESLTSPGFGVDSGAQDASKARSQELESWLKTVRARLGSGASANYPSRARRLQQEGTARLSVSIGQNGTILSVGLIQTSGHAALDEAALAGLRSLATVPAPPEGVGTTSVSIPVAFRLN
jgi:protein TonB